MNTKLQLSLTKLGIWIWAAEVIPECGIYTRNNYSNVVTRQYTWLAKSTIVLGWTANGTICR